MIFLEELVNAMDTQAEISIYASKLMVYFTDFIDNAGHGFCTILKGIGGGEVGRALIESKGVYIWNTREQSFYGGEIVNEVGFLDEDILVIHEDTD